MHHGLVHRPVQEQEDSTLTTFASQKVVSFFVSGVS
jgi:hypothetical protein